MRLFTWIPQQYRLGVIWLSAFLAPAIIGIVLFRVNSGGINGSIALPPCPIRSGLGIPCPFCGATRSTVLLLHGDGSWLQYNPWWPILGMIGILVGIGLLFANEHVQSRVRRWWKSESGWWLLGALVVGWIVAAINSAAILHG